MVPGRMTSPPSSWSRLRSLSALAALRSSSVGAGFGGFTAATDADAQSAATESAAARRTPLHLLVLPILSSFARIAGGAVPFPL